MNSLSERRALRYRPLAFAVIAAGLCLAAAGISRNGFGAVGPSARISAAGPPRSEAEVRSPRPAESLAAPSAVTSPTEEASREEIEEFLRTAKVDNMRVLSSGITKPLRLTLSRDGITRRAVFRHVDVYRPMTDTPDGIRLDYRDSAIFEAAAYRLARLFFVDHVPPTVVRKFSEEDFVHGSQILSLPAREGTLQLWVEKAMTEKHRRKESLTSPYALFWTRQFQEMWLFDALIFNEDRNQGNILIDADWKLWFIDATRSFRPFRELRDPDRIVVCRRRTWERLNQVTNEEIESAMEGLLSGGELRGLLERRRGLVEYLSELIKRRGESAVLFEYNPAQAESESNGAVAAVH